MRIFAKDMVDQISLGLRWLWGRPSAPLAQAPAPEPQPHDVARRARAAYSELRRLGSNRELDWLWIAAQLTDPAARRDALQRALAINPRSELARQELALLEQQLLRSLEDCPA